MLWAEGIATRTHNVAQDLSVVLIIAKKIFQTLEVTGIVPLTAAKVRFSTKTFEVTSIVLHRKIYLKQCNLSL